jgi:hypothetical protein
VVEASSVEEEGSRHLPSSNVVVDSGSNLSLLDQQMSATFVANVAIGHVTAFKSRGGVVAKHVCTTCRATWHTCQPRQHHFHLPPTKAIIKISQKTDRGADEHPARREGPTDTTR